MQIAFLTFKKFAQLLLVPVVLFFAACATTSKSIEGNYTLTDLVGYDSLNEAVVSMTITEDRISGKGPINSWNGALEYGEIGVMISTKMAGPPELMQMEMALYAAFTNGSVSSDGDTLKISRDGATAAVFERVD